MFKNEVFSIEMPHILTSRGMFDLMPGNVFDIWDPLDGNFCQICNHFLLWGFFISFKYDQLDYLRD